MEEHTYISGASLARSQSHRASAAVPLVPCVTFHETAAEPQLNLLRAAGGFSATNNSYGVTQTTTLRACRQQGKFCSV